MNYSPKNYQNRIEKYENLIDLAETLDKIDLPEDTDEVSHASFRKEINGVAKDFNQATSDLLSDVIEDISEDLNEKINIYVEQVNLNQEQDIFPLNEWVDDISFRSRKWTLGSNYLKEICSFEINDNEKKALLYENSYEFLKLTSRTNTMYLKKEFFAVKEFLKKHAPENFFNHLLFNKSIYTYTQSLRESNLEEMQKQLETKSYWSYYASLELSQQWNKEEGIDLWNKFVLITKPTDNEENNTNIKQIIHTMVKDVFLNLYLAPDDFFTKNNVYYHNEHKITLSAINWERIKEWIIKDKENNNNLTEKILETLQSVIDSHKYTLKNREHEVNQYTDLLGFVRTYDFKQKLSNNLDTKNTTTIKNKI